MHDNYYNQTNAERQEQKNVQLYAGRGEIELTKA